MDYGTKALQRHNSSHAKPGDRVTLGEVCRAGLLSIAGIDASEATLTRRQQDGIWFADVAGSEWCIGSGYDWRLKAA